MAISRGQADHAYVNIMSNHSVEKNITRTLDVDTPLSEDEQAMLVRLGAKRDHLCLRQPQPPHHPHGCDEPERVVDL